LVVIVIVVILVVVFWMNYSWNFLFFLLPPFLSPF